MKEVILSLCTLSKNKVLLVLAVTIFTVNIVSAQDSSGFSLAGGKFGEINVKFGYQFEGLARDNITEWFDYDINNFYHTDPGFSFGAEYLYSFFDKILKMGVGEAVWATAPSSRHCGMTRKFWLEHQAAYSI